MPVPAVVLVPGAQLVAPELRLVLLADALVAAVPVVAVVTADVPEAAVPVVAVVTADVRVAEVEPGVAGRPLERSDAVAVSRAAASHASSAVKSSTICRPPPSVASRFPEVTVRSSGCHEVRR